MLGKINATSRVCVGGGGGGGEFGDKGGTGGEHEIDASVKHQSPNMYVTNHYMSPLGIRCIVNKTIYDFL
jgi:hypothetical protein